MRYYSIFLIGLLSFQVSESLALTCGKNEYLVKAHHRRSYARYDGKVISVSSVKAHCKKKRIIDETWLEIFKPKAPQNWPHKTEVFKEWPEDERERVLEILETLPEDLISNNVKGIYRATKSRLYPNPATSADSIIVIYDSAFTNNADLQRILSHEFAHQMYTDLADKDLQDYQYATNWLPIRDKVDLFVSRKVGFVQDDGRDSPEEDFANNIEFYLKEPEQLKKITPNAYRWIKDRYGGKFKYRKESK